MQLVEKACDVLRLSREALARSSDDLRIKPEALGDIDSRRRSRHSHLELVCRLERLLVKPDRGVYYARRVGGVNL